jgi:hypothetical protein
MQARKLFEHFGERELDLPRVGRRYGAQENFGYLLVDRRQRNGRLAIGHPFFHFRRAHQNSSVAILAERFHVAGRHSRNDVGQLE